MFDCTAFLRRMGWAQKDLAERLGIATSTVGMWCIGKSAPPFPAIEKLLLMGITPLELFGKEIDEKLKAYYYASFDSELPKGFETPEFIRGVEKAYNELKANGRI